MKEKGKYSSYIWLQADYTTDYTDKIFTLIAPYLRNKFLVVTAIDSGPLSLIDEEKELGWKTINSNAYFGPITNEVNIPSAEYSEYYLFEREKVIESNELFVNWGNFSINNPVIKNSNIDPTWDRKAIEHHEYSVKKSQELFWNQILKYSPYLYFSTGDNLIFTTIDTDLFGTVYKAL